MAEYSKKQHDNLVANGVIVLSAMSLVTTIIVFAAYNIEDLIVLFPLFIESLGVCLGVYLRLGWKLRWFPFLLLIIGATLVLVLVSSLIFSIYFYGLGQPDLMNNTELLKSWTK